MTVISGDNKRGPGLVLRIEHASIYDGDGIRTVVFMKGCHLNCRWCSTPESQSFAVEQDREGKSYGRWMSVEQVMREIHKDELFFFHSGGGVTFSGGEPLNQAGFVQAVLERCRYFGIGTAIETSLHADYSLIAPLLPLLDLIYVDLKAMDAARHRELAGVDNALILDNIRRLDAALIAPRLILRMPVIPGLNDDAANLRLTAGFCAGLRHLRCLELLPYHRLGVATYARLGREYALPEVKTPDRGQMQSAADIIRASAPELKLSVR